MFVVLLKNKQSRWEKKRLSEQDKKKKNYSCVVQAEREKR